MVTNFTMPPKPHGNEKTLTRVSGVRYAQRVLREIDATCDSIEAKSEAFGEAFRDTSRAPDCEFKEGLYNALRAAESTLSEARRKAGTLRGQIEQGRAKATAERDRLLSAAQASRDAAEAARVKAIQLARRAEDQEREAQSTFERLSHYVTTLENALGRAEEVQVHDARFV